MPKTKLVGFEVAAVPKTKKGQLLYVVFEDKNGNGKLDSKDVKYEIYDQTLGKMAADKMKVYSSAIKRGDIKKYARRFRRSARTARKQRAWMSGIPAIKGGLCYAYWPGSILPNPKKLIFSKNFTLSTRLYSSGFKRIAPPSKGRIAPRFCRAVEATVRLPRPDVEKKSLKVRVSAGGIVYPGWLSILFGAHMFIAAALKFKGRVAASYSFKGSTYIHLGLSK
jgi:hypothetical protein